MTQTLIRQPTSPLRLKAALREAQRRAVLAEQPTVHTGAIRPVQRMPVSPYTTKPLLPLDELGRPYVAITSEREETALLVRQAVERYHSLQGCYPSVVLLSAFRYLTVGLWMGYYYPGGQAKPIPYGYEPNGTYDVLCRGEGVDAWVR